MMSASSPAPSAGQTFAPILAASLLVAAAVWALREWVDGPAADLFHAYDRTLWTAPAEAVTELGHWVAWLVGTSAIALAAYAARRPVPASGAFQLATALLLAGIVGTAMKVAFGAPGPDLSFATGSRDFTWFRWSADWHAFPSGHAITAGAVAATAWLGGVRWRGGIVAASLFVAASRFIIAVHFISDVVAGVALGALSALIVHEAARRMAWRASAPHASRSA